MPTLTLSWTDVALLALTAGLIGGIVLVGGTNSATSKGEDGVWSHGKKAGQSKKKKKPTKKRDPPSGPPPPSTSSPSSSSAAVHPRQPPSSLPSTAHPLTPPEPTTLQLPSTTHPQPVVDPPELLPPPTQSQSTKKKKAPKKPAQPIHDQEFPPLTALKDEQANQKHKPKRPYAERHQQPVRKTIVDDMIDEDVQKPLKMARVMNIVGPVPEDSLSPASDPEDGWEKVPDSKRSRTTGITISIGSSSGVAPSAQAKPKATSAEQATSKRQRQNAKKKEAAKALKQAQEADRLSHLSAHKREQERLRMNAQTRPPHPATNVPSSKPSGKKTASASIAEDGRLIWE